MDQRLNKTNRNSAISRAKQKLTEAREWNSISGSYWAPLEMYEALSVAEDEISGLRRQMREENDLLSIKKG